MKKVFTLLSLLMLCSLTFASEPDMKGTVFKDNKTGEVLEFDTNKVVYKIPKVSFSRPGEYTIGDTEGLKQSPGSNKSIKIVVSVNVGESTIKLSGTITYNLYSGRPINLFINGRCWTRMI